MYWQNYNPALHIYTSNDYTKFISQAMTAGGWTPVESAPGGREDDNNWYYGTFTFTTSYTWTAAENWYWFARNSGRSRMLPTVRDVSRGDVVQIDFDPASNILDHT